MTNILSRFSWVRSAFSTAPPLLVLAVALDLSQGWGWFPVPMSSTWTMRVPLTAAMVVLVTAACVVLSVLARSRQTRASLVSIFPAAAFLAVGVSVFPFGVWLTIWLTWVIIDPDLAWVVNQFVMQGAWWLYEPIGVVSLGFLTLHAVVKARARRPSVQ